MTEYGPILVIILQLIFLEGILSIDNAAVIGALVTPLPNDEGIPWSRGLKKLGKWLHPFLGNQRLAALRVGYSDFLAGRLDDGTVIAPTVGIKTQINPRLSLEAGAGLSFSRVNGLTGRDTSLVPSARVVLCETNVDNKNCIRISRGSQPTAANGLTTVTTVSVSHTQKLSQWDQLSIGANYTRSDRSSIGRTRQGYELLTASASYDHSFNRRFAAFVNPSYTRLFDSNVRRRADVAVLIGLRYRIGSEG